MALIKVGVIGFGNCGNQIANKASERGFEAIAINGSQRDLDLLSDTVSKICIGDGKGTGKNRDVAKDFFNEHIAILEDETLLKLITSNDVIIVVSSTGGGFGSAVSMTFTEKLQEITEGKKIFIPVGVFPVETESYTAQDHTIQYLNEVIELDCPFMLYDNNKFNNLPPTDASEKMNNLIVDDLCVIRGDYITSTNAGGIDERDLITTLSVPGRLVIGKLDTIDESMIQNGIIGAIKHQITEVSGHANLVEDKKITASAVMYNLRKEFDRYTTAIESDIQTIFGGHITDYRNETTIEDGEDDNVALLLVGLSLPSARVERIIKRHEALEKEITNVKSSSTGLGKVKTGGLKIGAKQTFATNTKPKINTKELVDKFQNNSK